MWCDGGLANTKVSIFLQYTSVLNQHVIHSKLIQCYSNYISRKLENNNNKCKEKGRKKSQTLLETTPSPLLIQHISDILNHVGSIYHKLESMWGTDLQLEFSGKNLCFPRAKAKRHLSLVLSLNPTYFSRLMFSLLISSNVFIYSEVYVDPLIIS